MSRVNGLVVIALLMSIGAMFAPFMPQSTALAECSRPNRWPSFAKVAPRADTVLVGTVTKIVSYWRHELPGTFAVKVEDVLKGHARTHIRLSGVYTTGGCVVSWLEVKRGDRIAVALGGTSNVNGPVSAVAFLSPLQPLAYVDMAGLRRLTIAQVREAVGLPATDAVLSDTKQASPRGAPGTAAWATAVVAFVSLCLRGLRAAF